MPSDLVSKLRAWGAAGPARAPAPAPARGIESVVPGRYVRTPYGECFVVERVYSAATRQGAVALAEALALTARARQMLAGGQAPACLDPRQALFLDTETTGLAGGTGTYAFLVGVAFFDGDRLRLQQYFMRHPSEERALLAALTEVLAAFPQWVTFNGKAFDAPLLETRYLLARWPAPQPAYHLDLLHPARRLWRRHLPSCALRSLEQALLGVVRPEDVPAWLIPSLYFDYVRQGRCAPLRSVFAHNAEDLLSLVALLGLIGDVLERPERYARHTNIRAVLRLYGSLGLAGEAAAWCRAALAALPAPERPALLWELALLLRRQGRREAAVAVWRELARGAGEWAVAAHVELAKYYEHERGDYTAAARATEAALTLLTLARRPASERLRLDLERRLGRLSYRARRAAGAPQRSARWFHEPAPQPGW